LNNIKDAKSISREFQFEFVDICDCGFKEFVVTNLNSGFLVENEFSVHLIME
jgi:hypothetical protein